jgi:hypothetical protein
MILPAFAIAFVLYCYVASLPYKNVSSLQYYLTGVAATVTCTILWLTVAKLIGDKDKILVAGIWWDTMIMLSYVIVPIAFYKAELTPMAATGILLIIVGIGLTKI